MTSYYERFFANTIEEIKGVLEHWVTGEPYRLSAMSYHTTVSDPLHWALYLFSFSTVEPNITNHAFDSSLTRSIN